jgi:hypothetical protein
MYVKFEELAEDSRVWVYQSSRDLSAQEISKIAIELKVFLESWTSHNKPIKAACQINYNRFIIIAVDKDFETSGCSIDTSVGFMRLLEKKYKVDLLEKTNIAYKTDDEIKYTSLADFKTLVINKFVNKDTVVFNNLVSTIFEYNNSWETTIKNSWHGRFL